MNTTLRGAAGRGWGGGGEGKSSYFTLLFGHNFFLIKVLMQRRVH